MIDVKINIASVIRNDGASKQFSGNVELGNVSFMGSTLDFRSPIEVSGTVRNVGGTLEVSGCINGEYFTECSRCGAEVREELYAELFESIDDDFQDLDEECIVITGNIMDISGSVEASIFGNIPMQFLCREDCKGLCPKCGTDLNKNECNCEEAEYDPRFAIFRNLSKEV